MKPKLRLIPFLSVLLLATASTRADIIWTGTAGDNDFFNPLNWDDETGPDADGNPETPHDSNITVTNAAATIIGRKKLRLMSGATLTVINSTLDFRPDPVAGQVYGLEGDTTDLDDDSKVILINSKLTVQSLANDLAVLVDSSSTLNLGGSGNAINGLGTPENTTRVELANRGKVVFISGCNASNTGSQTIGQRIFRDSSASSFATDYATPPLEEFILTGADTTPFEAPNSGAFTIAAGRQMPPPSPEIIVGYRGVPPEPAQAIWFPTLRTPTDWQFNLDSPNITNFGWNGILGFYLADINGDGLDDKVMYQPQGGVGPNIQTICAYTADGNFTNGNFMGDGDLEANWWDVANMIPSFGDIDGDGIDDSVVTVTTTAANVGNVNYIPNVSDDAVYWAAWESQNTPGISLGVPDASTPEPFDFLNFTGWSAFGTRSLGDLPLLGDFNGDGVDDRALHRTTTHQIFIDLSNPGGGWGDGVTDIGPLALGAAGDQIRVSDINGDGHDDLVVIRKPGSFNPGFQELYGYFNDQNGFAALINPVLVPENNLPAPNISDIFGLDDKVLFGRISYPEADPGTNNFRITQITAAGPDSDFTGTFLAPEARTYQIQASLTLAAGSWQNVGSVVVGTAGSAAFGVTDAALDTAFGTAARTKVFIRISRD